DVLIYGVQAVRWQLLLKLVGKIKLSQAAGAPRRRFSSPKLVTSDEKRVYSSRARQATAGTEPGDRRDRRDRRDSETERIFRLCGPPVPAVSYIRSRFHMKTISSQTPDIRAGALSGARSIPLWA